MEHSLSPRSSRDTQAARTVIEGAAIDVGSIISRMKKAYEVKSDNDLAAQFNVAKTTISSWRQRNTIPLDVCVKAAMDNLEYLDWIVFGRRADEMSPGIYEVGVDVELLSICMYAFDRESIGQNIDDPVARSGLRARFLLHKYARSLHLMREATQDGGVTRAQFLRSLRQSYEVLSGPVPDDVHSWQSTEGT